MMNTVFNWLKKNRMELLGSVVAGLAAVFLFSTAMALAGQDELRNDVIRLHILAHDDSEHEQGIKYLVRDEIWRLVQELTYGVRSMNEARSIISENLIKIEDAAWDLLKEHGSPHPVEARLTNSLVFPPMSYGTVFLPAGQYEALQIIIGDGAGENWWCVMFPSLCLMDITRGQISPQEGDSVTLRPRIRLFR